MIELRVGSDGTVRLIYQESIDLRPLGSMEIRRASRVEPIAGGRWIADLTLSGGPILGPLESRSEALAVEFEWLEAAGFPQLHANTRHG
jgi:hypothetical protein